MHTETTNSAIKIMCTMHILYLYSIFVLAGSGCGEYNAPIGGVQGYLISQKAELNLKGSHSMACCQEHS